MTPSELAEIVSQLEFSKDCRKKTNGIYCCPVLREDVIDHILKSLRFAAYMERLLESDDRELVFRKLCRGEIHVSSMWRENDKLRIFSEVFSSQDIYSAARSAVEALEGKNEI